MTLQEINDKIRARLLDGTGQAGTFDGADGTNYTCSYRTGDGRHCAVGHVVQDEYDSRMEGASIKEHVTIKEGKWYSTRIAYLPSSRLAEVLNSAKIPATPEVFRALIRWQERHDDVGNWEGNKYTGPLSDPA